MMYVASYDDITYENTSKGVYVFKASMPSFNGWQFGATILQIAVIKWLWPMARMCE